METKCIQYIRDKLCENATYTAFKADGTKEIRKSPIHIVCDNSLNCIDDHRGSVIWDDANEVFVYFTYNTSSTFYNSLTESISMGGQITVPGVAIMVDYSEIQNMRILLNKEILENVEKQLTMTDAQKDFLDYKYFKALDEAYNIKQKKNMNYVTAAPNESQVSKASYSDSGEYHKTVNPVAW